MRTAPDYPWVMTQDEIKARIKALLGKGWTLACLGKAFGFTKHNAPGSMVIHKLSGHSWIYPGEQVRMSRALHMIEAGELKPVSIRTYRKPALIPIMVDPEPVKPRTTVQITPHGPRLKTSMPKRYTRAELFRRNDGR